MIYYLLYMIPLNYGFSVCPVLYYIPIYSLWSMLSGPWYMLYYVTSMIWSLWYVKWPIMWCVRPVPYSMCPRPTMPDSRLTVTCHAWYLIYYIHDIYILYYIIYTQCYMCTIAFVYYIWFNICSLASLFYLYPLPPMYYPVLSIMCDMFSIIMSCIFYNSCCMCPCIMQSALLFDIHSLSYIPCYLLLVFVL